MHKLQRDPVPPSGLKKYLHKKDEWSKSSPNKQERQEIWTKLDAMQGQRCAYCEAKISEDKHHIEHFRRRKHYPQDTFVWDNLFGSCVRTDTCGHHKDGAGKCAAYQPEDLIKPDIDDPEDYLIFASDGSVAARASLNAAQKHRATETIRVFNLNGPLTQTRKTTLQKYIKNLEHLLAQQSEADYQLWVKKEIEDTAHLPFATAIRHVLTNQA